MEYLEVGKTLIQTPISRRMESLQLCRKEWGKKRIILKQRGTHIRIIFNDCVWE